MIVRPMSSRLLWRNSALVATSRSMSRPVATSRGAARQVRSRLDVSGPHAARHVMALQGRAHNDTRGGLSDRPAGLFDSPDLGARYADDRAVLSDAPSGVFDSPDAGVGQISMIGRPSAGRCASAHRKKHNNKQPKGYKSRPEFVRGENPSH